MIGPLASGGVWLASAAYTLHVPGQPDGGALGPQFDFQSQSAEPTRARSCAAVCGASSSSSRSLPLPYSPIHSAACRRCASADAVRYAWSYESGNTRPRGIGDGSGTSASRVNTCVYTCGAYTRLGYDENGALRPTATSTRLRAASGSKKKACRRSWMPRSG